MAPWRPHEPARRPRQEIYWILNQYDVKPTLASGMSLSSRPFVQRQPAYKLQRSVLFLAERQERPPMQPLGPERLGIPGGAFSPRGAAYRPRISQSTPSRGLGWGGEEDN